MPSFSQQIFKYNLYLLNLSLIVYSTNLKKSFKIPNGLSEAKGEERQTIQSPKEKRTKRQAFHKTLHKNLTIEQHEPD